MAKYSEEAALQSRLHGMLDRGQQHAVNNHRDLRHHNWWKIERDDDVYDSNKFNDDNEYGGYYDRESYHFNLKDQESRCYRDS